MHAYEFRPRKDKRGVDLISDALTAAPLGKRRRNPSGTFQGGSNWETATLIQPSLPPLSA
jgi:hypothetical protein